jgi:hypothetical protein
VVFGGGGAVYKLISKMVGFPLVITASTITEAQEIGYFVNTLHGENSPKMLTS